MNDSKVCRFQCWLAIDDEHPILYGDCLLPRDDDGVGFELTGARRFDGKYVEITIREVPEPGRVQP